MNKLEFQDLFKNVAGFLEEFDPSGLAYLNPKGTWVGYPRTLRDRISNELWFRIWEAKQNKEEVEQLRRVICPFIRDEGSWEVTNRVFSRILGEKTAKSDSVLMIFEVLYRLIEYDVDKRNAEIYVSDWDSMGKAWQSRCLGKAEEFLRDVKRTLRSNSKMDIWLDTIHLLRKDKECVFSQVSSLIAEEEKVRNQIDDSLTRLKGAEEENPILEVIHEQIGSAMKRLTAVPASLTRPCLELLTNPDIDVSSGLQYEASSILGELKDVRCTNTLLSYLETCDPGHTNIRCNLIYALGNLHQKRALHHLVDVLEGPDSIHVQLGKGSSGYDQPLLSEKQEAIWALGKLGPDAIEVIPALIKYSQDPNREMKISLAWTMGTIGHGQKKRYKGIDAGIVTTLMHLLTAEDSEIFEEAAVALRKLDLPNFLYTLYLHNFTTATLLSLKPSRTGLYELSETLLHLVSIKKPVVMAVTGDSGTGKTYFCESIANGFGELQENEIVYLQRDHPAHMKILKRMLGIKWLTGHVDQIYYQDYPLDENEDNPHEFFDDFIQDHAQARLIILDGWRDEPYFHQIVRIFYQKGYLDVLVKFRTTFSTRRINLEDREGALESVKTRLSLVEEPVIEETRFYQEGAVLIYNLDNSISSRLSREEIREVYQRKKVDTWGDQIRIGRFEKDARPLRIYAQILSGRWEDISVESQTISRAEVSRFSPQEATFSRILNENIAEQPNLLQVIEFVDLRLNRIAFYTQGQIACCGYDGDVGILTGFNDRLYYYRAHEQAAEHLVVVGGDICSVDSEGELKITTFQKNTVTTVEKHGSPVCSLASYRDDQILTGHRDGTIRLWNVPAQQVNVLQGQEGPVYAMAVDSHGRIFWGGGDGELCVWDPEDERAKVLLGLEAPISKMGLFPDGRVVMGTGIVDELEGKRRGSGAEISIVDFQSGACETFRVSDTSVVNALNVYFDGRIILGLTSSTPFGSQGNLVVIDHQSSSPQYKILGGHNLETRNCLTMGPRIITCGSESESQHTLRIWGTEHYVKREHDKLALMPESMEKPPYYRTLF
jgi:HEAT repeat protein